jgi:hypothetical protein
VFNTLSKLEFLKEKDPSKTINKAKGMYSKENEYVAFDNGESDVTVFEAKNEVENWLCDLEYMMRISL